MLASMSSEKKKSFLHEQDNYHQLVWIAEVLDTDELYGDLKKYGIYLDPPISDIHGNAGKTLCIVRTDTSSALRPWTFWTNFCNTTFNRDWLPKSPQSTLTSASRGGAAQPCAGRAVLARGLRAAGWRLESDGNVALMLASKPTKYKSCRKTTV